MEAGTPSRTALIAAAHRAGHQLLEQGRIFADPLALQILGDDAERIAREAAERPFSRRMRLFIAARTRFAEDALAAAVERGVRQLVVLGAGLDTYAYRGLLRDRLRVFEVDHPATQAWKRERLARARIQAPDSLTFVAVDFARDELTRKLAVAGFDPAQSSFFTCLGVVPYLPEDAVWLMLEVIAAQRGGAHVVFDYSDPPDTLSADARAMHEERARHVDALGETWVTYFDPGSLHSRLATIGFRQVEDLGPSEIVRRYITGTPIALPERGGHVLHAACGY